MSDRELPDRPLHFDAVLHPHRSLHPRGFVILMLFICIVSFGAGIAFLLIGAWPVLGFFGLDVVAIYLAFRLNYRAARLSETVQLSDEALEVCRAHPDGREERWTFQPYWTQLRLAQDGYGRGAVCLRSHGRELRIGAFLTADERREFTAALQHALKQHQS